MSWDRRIIFLCGEAEGEAFRRHAAQLDPQLQTLWVPNLAGLDLATRSGGHRTRLISFLTDIIVPESILARLRPTPINVHPGPPEYPGAHGLVFAIFDGAQRFGVTAHEMTARVDTGPILMVDRFSLPSDAELVPFGNEVYARAVGLADHVIHHCVKTDSPMKRRPEERWTDNHCTNKRLEKLLSAADSMFPRDRARLERAAGPHLAAYQRPGRLHG